METFRAYYTDIRASHWQQQAAAQLREWGLLTFGADLFYRCIISISGSRPLSMPGR
jgi:hypothetical protein